ncbi:MAG: TlpA disulfide reductase family protein [Rikenellaceae bacterium]
MKKLIYTLLAAATLISCGESNTFQISGSLPTADLNGKNIVLLDISSKDTVATCVVADQKFSFSGVVTQPSFYIVVAGEHNIIMLPAEAGKIDISIDENGRATVTGGQLNQAFRQIDNDAYKLESEFSEFYKAHQGDSEAIQQEYLKMQEGRNAIYEKAMEANSSNIIGAFCLDRVLSSEESLEKMDAMIAKVALASKFQPIVERRERLVALESTQAGKMFVDFDGTAIDGTKSSLSDYVGKGEYVLVDFWASWCGPCKGEIPNLKEVHELYKDKGFVMLGVNVWDKQEAFVAAVEEEGMTWSHIYASDDRTATDKYGIRGIPTIILFAPDGTIVDRTLRGEAIKAKLSEIYE